MSSKEMCHEVMVHRSEKPEIVHLSLVYDNCIDGIRANWLETLHTHYH